MNKFNRFLRSKIGLYAIASLIILAVAIAVVINIAGGPGTAGLASVPKVEYPSPVGGYTCLPSCAEDDGKFLAFVSAGLQSFGGNIITVWIAVPGNFQNLEIGFFDGDSGKDDQGNFVGYKGGNWDKTTGQTIYKLFADPMKDGSGKQELKTWHGNDDNMPNNAWFTATLPNDTAAKAPSGHYFYRLEMTAALQPVGINRVKLRTNGYLSTAPASFHDTGFAFVGGYETISDFEILKNLDGSSKYTGFWQFFTFVPVDSNFLEIWDGDFDRGTSEVVEPDTKDPNSDGIPPWAGPFTVPERAGKKGAPADDSFNNYLRRSPSVLYKLIDPAGAPIYINNDPSGTEEWEIFNMSTDPNSDADLIVDRIQPGLYTLQVEGLDAYNTVWLKLAACDPVSGCGPCVWPGCDNTACPRTIGYWKNNVGKVLIEKRTRGVQESPESLDWALKNVATASPLFRNGINIGAPNAIANPVRLTDDEAYQILMRGANAPYPADKNTMLARALQQNLAAWLNLASGKVSDNTVVTLNVAGGTFNGTIWEALQEAQEIILSNDTARMERAKDIGDQINNGLLGEDVEVGSCDAGTGDSKDYEKTMPKEKQPPKHKDMPKAPKPETPKQVTPGPEPVCSANNTYAVENPTNNPFYGIKFEFRSGVDVRDGSYDHFEVTLPADVVQSMTSIQLEAKSATNTSIVTLEADFTSPFGGGEPTMSESGLHGFAFMGAVDNGDGTYTLTFKIVVYDTHALSHATIGLPDGAVPSESGNYTSESCVAP